MAGPNMKHNTRMEYGGLYAGASRSDGRGRMLGWHVMLGQPRHHYRAEEGARRPVDDASGQVVDPAKVREARNK